MNVYFYSSFSKKTNSTKQPATTGSSFVVKDCKLKQDCSEHNPSFILSSNEYGYTYVYVPTWTKFYFVIDVISLANGLVEYQCSEDVLATFRANVMSTSSGILYSSYGYDVMVPDPRIKTKNHRQIDSTAASTGVVTQSFGYVVTVFNCLGNVSNSGGVTFSYLLNDAGMQRLRMWLSATGVSAAIASYMHGSLIDAFASCIRIPYFNECLNLNVTARTQMVIGDRYSYDNDGILFTAGELYSFNSLPTITKNYSLVTNLRYADFRAYEPYTYGVLYLPAIGTVPISKNEFMGGNIKIAVYIDVLTGDIKYVVRNGSDVLISTCNSNIAAQCPIGHITGNGSGIVSGLGATIGGIGALAATIATEGAAAVVAGAAFATIAGITNTVLSANQHSTSVSGGYSNNLASYAPYISYYEVSVDTQDPNDAAYLSLYGRPYIGNALLSTLIPTTPPYPTFVQTIDAHVNPSVSGSPVPNLREQTELNNTLNSGIYLE